MKKLLYCYESLFLLVTKTVNGHDATTRKHLMNLSIDEECNFSNLLHSVVYGKSKKRNGFQWFVIQCKDEYNAMSQVEKFAFLMQSLSDDNDGIINDLPLDEVDNAFPDADEEGHTKQKTPYFIIQCLWQTLPNNVKDEWKQRARVIQNSNDNTNSFSLQTLPPHVVDLFSKEVLLKKLSYHDNNSLIHF